MKRGVCMLLCVLLVTFVPDPLLCKRPFGGGRHTYPKSGGLSGGGGRHTYPSSGGLSGGGGSHTYPSSGGLSGGGRGYPSAGNNGYPSSGVNKGYPSSGSNHGYPNSGGLSGSGNSHGYPGSKPISGHSPSNTGHTTIINNHYNYNPPQQIRYTPTHGGPPVNYPVYHGTPPTYVYQYKDSGSKYGTLLAGLALLNLGATAATAYSLSKSHSNYKPQPGEICKFGIKKDNGDYEDTRIDCQLITSFIFQEEAKNANAAHNGTVVTTTVTNMTIVNTTNGGSETTTQPLANPLYEMLPNGTLVPVNNTIINGTMPLASNNTDTTVTSSVTITTTNTTVTNALDVKGKPIDVTPGMQCFVIRQSPTSNMKKSVPCGLLQAYADKSLQKRNSAFRDVPFLTSISVIVMFLLY